MRGVGGHLGVECQVASPATLSSLGPSPPLHSLSALNLPRSSPSPPLPLAPWCSSPTPSLPPETDIKRCPNSHLPNGASSNTISMSESVSLHLSRLQNVKGTDGDSEPHAAPSTLGVLSTFSDKNDNRPKGA